MEESIRNPTTEKQPESTSTETTQLIPDQKSTSESNKIQSKEKPRDDRTQHQMLSRAIEAVLSTPDGNSNTAPTNDPAPAQAKIPADEESEIQDVEPFDVLVSLAQTMAVSQHEGNKLLMTLCYQAAPHFAKCHDEKQKFALAERMLTKMQKDLGTRFLWESSHLPTPMELAITATCILVDLMPTQHDVVFTHHGSLVPEHSGNEFFTMLCQAFLIRLNDTQTIVTLDFIVTEMSKLLPPGRFLLAHEKEFKFTALDKDQLQCFLLRKIMEEDRKNHQARAENQRRNSEASNPKKRRASLPRGDPKVPETGPRTSKRTKAWKVPTEPDAELTDEDDGSTDDGEQQQQDINVQTKKDALRDIVVGKRQSKPSSKLLATREAEGYHNTNNNNTVRQKPTATMQANPKSKQPSTTNMVQRYLPIGTKPRQSIPPKPHPKIPTHHPRQSGIRIIYPTVKPRTEANGTLPRSKLDVLARSAVLSMTTAPPHHGLSNLAAAAAAHTKSPNISAMSDGLANSQGVVKPPDASTKEC